MRSLVTLALIGAATACSSAEGGGENQSDAIADPESGGNDTIDVAEERRAGDVDLGQAEQTMYEYGYGYGYGYGYSYYGLDYNYYAFDFAQSCSDPTGTNSVLAAIAVAAGTELRRWKSGTDFGVTNGKLELSPTGKARCKDGTCFNTQALLDLQSSPPGKVQIRPGVKLDPAALRWALVNGRYLQTLCLSVFGTPILGGCTVPEHELRWVHSEPGKCDTNYWFEVLNPDATAYKDVSKLKNQLLFVDVERNSYIQFQTNGNTVGIDPTYGLNEVGSTSTGACTAACTKISKSDITGTCCSCDGNRRYSRSSWSATTYLCQ